MKKTILELFAGMFPDATAIEFNFTDGVISTLINGERKDHPLDKESSQSNVMLLKDYLKIKDNINNIIINMKEQTVQVIHTTGTKFL